MSAGWAGHVGEAERPFIEAMENMMVAMFAAPRARPLAEPRPPMTPAELTEELTHIVCNGPVRNLASLLAAGARLDSFNTHGRTALMEASAAYQIGAMDALINAGADLDIASPTDGATALHVACLHGRSRAALVLLTAGANPHSRDAAGRRAADLVSTDAAELLDRRMGGGALCACVCV
jgi:ankyrin repeat protein